MDEALDNWKITKKKFIINYVNLFLSDVKVKLGESVGSSNPVHLTSTAKEKV